MKLISMTDFVFLMRENNEKGNIRRFWACERYAKFLKQPLTLGMFVPCDENGNVLEEPTLYDVMNDRGYFNYARMEVLEKEYQKAKEKVLFEGFRFENNKLLCRNAYVGLYVNEYSNIEELQNDDCYEIILTESAIKQIGL